MARALTYFNDRGGGGGGVSQENQDDPFPKNTRKPYNYNSVLFDLKSNCTI